MSLSRRLLLIVTALCALVFAGTFLITLDNTRRFLNDQLQAHAQDTATSLGLSLSPHVAAGDLATAEAMVDAVFDRGYFREIILTGASGEPLVDRVIEVQYAGVPAWFVRGLPLLTPAAEAVIQTGWRQGGRVRVRSHPGFAYRELWRSAVATFAWGLGALVLATVLVRLLLRRVLASLHAVETQAEAVGRGEFPRLAHRPRTRELARIVAAMNQMTAKVEGMLGEQVRVAEQLRAEAFTDPVTGLANRHRFVQRLEHLTGAAELHASGVLLLVRIQGLERVNRERGYAAGDAVLARAAALLTEASSPESGLVARLDGAEFGLLVEDLSSADGRRLAAGVMARFAGFAHEGSRLDGVNLGGSCFAGRGNASALLARADLALRRAEGAGPDTWRFEDEESAHGSAARGAEQWRALIERAIASGDVRLWLQPVRTPSLAAELYREVLARLRDADGRDIVAGAFVPMAERLGLAAALDRVVVSRVLEHIASAEAPDGARFAVNLSPGAVRDPAFGDWLAGRLGAAASRLVFEVGEHNLRAAPEAVRALASALGRAGSALAIERFGLGGGAFGYLRSLPVAYLKLDGSLLVDVERDRDAQFYVQALGEIARGLEIPLIAEFVEREGQIEVLRRLRVAGVQGYLVGAPAPAA